MSLSRLTLLITTILSMSACGNSQTLENAGDLLSPETIGDTTQTLVDDDSQPATESVTDNDDQYKNEATVEDTVVSELTNAETDKDSVSNDSQSSSNEDVGLPLEETASNDTSANESSVPTVETSAPENLTGVAYTDTEIELFWDRSTDPSVVNYRISRDGNELVVIDALSYYDNSVQPGNTYEYTVQSVDYKANVGVAANLFLTTPSAAPTINASNADEIIAYVASIANGQLFENIIGVSASINDLVVDSTIQENGFVETNRFLSEDENAQVREYNCTSGTLTTGLTFNLLPSSSGEFNDCKTSLYSEHSINGKFANWRELVKYVGNPGISNEIRLDNFSIAHSDGKSETINGEYYRFDGNGNKWSYFQSTTALRDDAGNYILDDEGAALTESTPLTYRSPAFKGLTTVSVTDITITHGTSDGKFKHQLGAVFTVQAPETGNKLISVTTPELFGRTSTNFFTEGRLQLSAADGSSVIIDANTGDVETVQVSISADGITTDETRNWTQPVVQLLTIPSD